MPSAREIPPPVRQNTGRELLDKILERTALLSGSEEVLAPTEREALTAVARAHRGHPLTLEPVLVELLEVILQIHAPAPPAAPGFWHSAALEIGQVLLEDPTAARRLTLFWDRLSQDLP